MTDKIVPGTSPKAKNLSARLAAVQAVYQALLNGQSLKVILDEYISHGTPRDAAEPMVQPDGSLLQKILLGIQERRDDLETLIKRNYTKENRELEPLLKSILLCAAYELVANGDIDAPIIINDYLNVTHSFYEAGEVSLVNGILDAIKKAVRS